MAHNLNAIMVDYTWKQHLIRRNNNSIPKFFLGWPLL